MIQTWLRRAAMAALLPTLPLAAQQTAVTQVAGGGGGTAFTDSQPSPGARIIEVRIHSAERVHSVQMIYLLPFGRTIEGLRRGGPGGREQIFRLEDDEYIVGLSGRCGEGIDSIRIHSNRRVSQLYGGRGGDRDFNVSVPAGSQAIGFAGRAGDYLDAIWLTYGLLSLSPARRDTSLPAGRGEMRQQAGQAALAGQTTLTGGGGGNSFADNPPQGARITEVRVWSGDRVDAIQAIYLLPDGRTVDGTRHGGSGGRSTRFQLDRDEYIIGMSGRYGEVIDSIRIHTNRRSSEQFGGRGGDRDYRIEVPANQQVVGFAGRSGDLLDAIGLVYAPVTGTRFSPGRSRRPY